MLDNVQPYDEKSTGSDNSKHSIINKLHPIINIKYPTLHKGMYWAKSKSKFKRLDSAKLQKNSFIHENGKIKSMITIMESFFNTMPLNYRILNGSNLGKVMACLLTAKNKYFEKLELFDYE